MSAAEDPERVLLVYGLWMNPLAMYPLGFGLRRCGFAVSVFRYPTVRSPIEDNAKRLAAWIAGAKARVLHLVGHSLGGVVILRALAQGADPRVKRVVLLGTPVAGSLAGRSFGQTRLGRWMLGKTLPVWHAGSPPAVAAGVEIGVLAGNLPIGLGRLVTRLPCPHDGAVTVAETRLEGASDSVVLRVNHTGMLFSARVSSQVCAFLHHGRFRHSG
jgi:pimeloyl-ACP methyl ester carboxylesterase